MPLTEGSSIVMVGVANDFYGWGFVARLKDLEDVDVKTDKRSFDYNNSRCQSWLNPIRSKKGKVMLIQTIEERAYD